MSEPEIIIPQPSSFIPPITGAERVALRILQAGAIAVAFAVTIRRAFELDRFLVPKELVLHLTAFLAILFAFGAIRRSLGGRIDLLLTIYLALSAVSAVFATNRWLGLRALAVSASAIGIFWTARALRQRGVERALLIALAIAVVAAAVTSLLQAYGVRLDIFAANRSPGGTLGNRNFVAHAAAFGMPVCMFVAITARRYVIACAGVIIVMAALVLPRSRAAWLAAAAMLVIFIVSILISPALRRSGVTWKRFAGLIVVAGVSVAAAMVIPNTLRWRSDNPYLESVVGVANYEEGSGRGRLLQYQRSLRMALGHPLFGVGPGNWPVVYPNYAVRNDPSMDTSEGGMTFNPWPSSDWVAFIAERGLAAAIVLATAIAAIALNAFRTLRTAADSNHALGAATLLATLAAAVIAGAFDAVLLLALPALIVWAAVGALHPAPPVPTEGGARWTIAVIAIMGLCAIGAARSAAQLVSIEAYATGGRATMQRAARIDPSNYRLQLRLAQGGGRARCQHALAARALFPSSHAARAANGGCDAGD